ncbi:hypothetical protein [Paractinoplanes rishiriensis]|nr:hypothetical protein [Actinoplanes rishiriensis]
MAAVAVLSFGCASPGTGTGAATPAEGSPSPFLLPTPAGPGDAAPNHADNNAWKQRAELTAAQKRAGEKLAGQLKPRLEKLRKAGDFRPTETREVLLDLGADPDTLIVTPMRVPEWWTASTPPEGAFFAVQSAEFGCLIGDVRPERVLVEVRGANPEFGCVEPHTH